MTGVVRARPPTGRDLQVREPTLQLSLFVEREVPFVGTNEQTDPRRLLFQNVCRFIEKCTSELKTDELQKKYGVGEVVISRNREWDEVLALGGGLFDRYLKGSAAQPSDVSALLEAYFEVRTGGQELELYRCRIGTLNDVLVFQIGIGRYDPWAASLSAGWHELQQCLKWGFEDGLPQGACKSLLGASVLYWATTENGGLAEYGPEAVRIVDPAADPGEDPYPHTRFTQTEFGNFRGCLWHSDQHIFSEANSVPQEQWILITPKVHEVQQLVNQLYFERGAEVPFLRMSLARHRHRFHEIRFWRDRPFLQRQQRDLDDTAEALLDKVGSVGTRITHFRSSDSEAFQDELKSAAHQLAKYRTHTSEVKRLRRTLEVARHDFLINCVPLISIRAARRVTQADAHDQAALQFLAQWQAEPDGGDEFFRSELGRMSGPLEQVQADLDYAEWVTDRNTAALQSGTEQLQIASQRELGEMSHHLALDSAAVVPSLVAFVVVEALVKPLNLTETVFGVGLIFSSASLAFTTLVWQARRTEPRGPLELTARRLTLAFIVATVVLQFVGQSLLGAVGELLALLSAHPPPVDTANARFLVFALLVLILTCLMWVVERTGRWDHLLRWLRRASPRARRESPSPSSKLRPDGARLRDGSYS